MYQLINNAKRLIEINAPMKVTKVEAKYDKTYQVLPADPAGCTVPKEIYDLSYVQALIKCGDLIAHEVGSSESEQNDLSGMSKDDLIEMAEVMGVELKSKDTVAQIIAKIEAAQ